jgi:hypothetical protein
MKKRLSGFIFLLLTFPCFSQEPPPVKWSYTAKKINVKTYEIHLTATITDGWHIYSQTTPEGGPVKTHIEFAKNPLASLQGDTREIGQLEQHFEELFGVDVKQFSNKVDFVQTVALKAAVKTTLAGTVVFMTCNDHECLPPSKWQFSVPLN